MTGSVKKPERGMQMMEEIIETVVEVAVDVAEAVITDKIKKSKKETSHSCDSETK